MKVTTEETNKKQEIKYPCIMELTTNPEVIVYVTGEEDGEYMGIALSHPELEYWDKEITEWDMDVFVPMKGKVILEND